MAAALAANEVISFYSYTPVTDPEAQAWQRETGAQLALHGRVIVATEGVSGTASGAAAATREYVSKLEAALGLDRPRRQARASRGERRSPTST